MRNNPAYARYRWREKHRRQYTFTKSKFLVGFVLSVITSVFLGTYLERYGGVVLKQSVSAFQKFVIESVEEPEAKEELEESSEEEQEPMSALEQKLAQKR